MFYKTLATVSAVALLTLIPAAMAEDVDSAAQQRIEAETGFNLNTQTPESVEPSAGTRGAESNIDTQTEMRTGAQSGTTSDRVDVENNMTTSGNTVREDVKESWEKTKQAVSETMDDVEYTLFDKDAKGVQSNIAAGATARGFMNRAVYNERNERVGTLRDIIVDDKGVATLAIVSDSEITAIGKEAAFDYGLVLRRDQDGDIVMPLSEETINRAQRFSYDRDNAGKEGVRTITTGSYSIDELMEANVVNQAGEKVASVDNITFRNGRADALIVGFDKVLGMGGKKAALPFSNVKMITKGDNDVDFQLTASQAAQFETFKQSASN